MLGQAKAPIIPKNVRFIPPKYRSFHLLDFPGGVRAALFTSALFAWCPWWERGRWRIPKRLVFAPVADQPPSAALSGAEEGEGVLYGPGTSVTIWARDTGDVGMDSTRAM